MPIAHSDANTISVAREISRLSDMGTSDSIYAAKRLFAFHHDEGNRLHIEVADDAELFALAEMCNKTGIVLLRGQEDS